MGERRIASFALALFALGCGGAPKTPPPAPAPVDEEAFVLDGPSSSDAKTTSGTGTTAFDDKSSADMSFGHGGDGSGAGLPVNRELGGVALGTQQTALSPVKDPHPLASTGPLTGFRWMAPQKPLTVAGIDSSVTHLGFVSDRLGSIYVKIVGQPRCQQVESDLEMRNRKPSSREDRGGSAYVKWDDGVTALDFRWQSSRGHSKDACIVWLTDHASLHHNARH